MRPLSTLSNDTVYITRLMIPFYYQDEVSFFQDEGLPLPHEYRSSHKSEQTSNSLSHEKQQKMLKRFHSLPFGAEMQ